MNIAYTMAPGRGDTDRLLAGVARVLLERGRRVLGTVQINTERDVAGPCAGPCDMDVKVLPDGPMIRISQDLGRGAGGCRLDPDALETAVGLVEAGLGRGADCLIVNKFGKHEAEGRGFRPLIAEALSRDIPVLVGVNSLNAPAFLAFAASMAVSLDPCAETLERWLEAEIARGRQIA